MVNVGNDQWYIHGTNVVLDYDIAVPGDYFPLHIGGVSLTSKKWSRHPMQIGTTDFGSVGYSNWSSVADHEYILKEGALLNALRWYRYAAKKKLIVPPRASCPFVFDDVRNDASQMFEIRAWRRQHDLYCEKMNVLVSDPTLDGAPLVLWLAATSLVNSGKKWKEPIRRAREVAASDSLKAALEVIGRSYKAGNNAVGISVTGVQKTYDGRIQRLVSWVSSLPTTMGAPFGFRDYFEQVCNFAFFERLHSRLTQSKVDDLRSITDWLILDVPDIQKNASKAGYRNDFDTTDEWAAFRSGSRRTPTPHQASVRSVSGLAQVSSGGDNYVNEATDGVAEDVAPPFVVGGVVAEKIPSSQPSALPNLPDLDVEYYALIDPTPEQYDALVSNVPDLEFAMSTSSLPPQAKSVLAAANSIGDEASLSKARAMLAALPFPKTADTNQDAAFNGMQGAGYMLQAVTAAAGPETIAALSKGATVGASGPITAGILALESLNAIGVIDFSPSETAMQLVDKISAETADMLSDFGAAELPDQFRSVTQVTTPFIAEFADGINFLVSGAASKADLSMAERAMGTMNNFVNPLIDEIVDAGRDVLTDSESGDDGEEDEDEDTRDARDNGGREELWLDQFFGDKTVEAMERLESIRQMDSLSPAAAVEQYLFTREVETWVAEWFDKYLSSVALSVPRVLLIIGFAAEVRNAADRQHPDVNWEALVYHQRDEWVSERVAEMSWAYNALGTRSMVTFDQRISRCRQLVKRPDFAAYVRYRAVMAGGRGAARLMRVPASHVP